MKALVLVGHPENKIQLLEVEKPVPTEGKVLIKLKAAALNRRDQWIREGKYPNIQMNTILGSDGAGIVEEVGAGISSDLIGNEVIINPNIDWGENPKVQSKAYHILGMPTNGTFAEYVVVEASKINQKPAHLSWAEAASIPLGGLTAFRAVFTQGQVAAGQNVLISGAGGGVAQFAMLYALAAQANVYVTSGSADKINTCIGLGAKAGFNYKTKDWQKEALQASGGFDVVIDSAGGDQLNDFIKMMKPSGRIVFYGATNGTPQKLDMFRMFWNQITLQGSTMGNDQEFGQMVTFINEHKIKPILDSVRPFSKIVSAFDAMKNGGTFGKLVVNMKD
ncbi:zinc-binding dehydrogenase [uncultured Roseivirga sp.]|uniref:zinc-binding dehydrogenase n=1 Tax=uncultured Roseivirga sp. TaxID=543088 RepID=UPI0030DA53B8|tara:strand:- start:2862 stop:3866 length:1005 start_codon:yes stop_codon:yes gene_type:complete